MPHAVILEASEAPEFGNAPLTREGGTIHKVAEMAHTANGWLLKSLIIHGKNQTKFLTRIDKREDGLVIRLDDHVDVERNDDVFDHLARIAERTLEANPGSKLGPTNLSDRIGSHAKPPEA